mmetsp:Transcript_75523/g.233647  ORF Transcript_75523/g.233647 Transcript_75523/m.233647 type:complete len:220 (+) Transcript_75523:1281-1940(+)
MGAPSHLLRRGSPGDHRRARHALAAQELLAEDGGDPQRPTRLPHGNRACRGPAGLQQGEVATGSATARLQDVLGAGEAAGALHPRAGKGRRPQLCGAAVACQGLAELPRAAPTPEPLRHFRLPAHAVQALLVVGPAGVLPQELDWALHSEPGRELRPGAPELRARRSADRLPRRDQRSGVQPHQPDAEQLRCRDVLRHQRRLAAAQRGGAAPPEPDGSN